MTQFFLYFEKFCYWFLLETDLNKNWYYSEFELMGRDLGFMTRFWMSMTKFFDIMNSFMIAEINKTPWFYQWICDTQIMWKLFYVILLRIIVLSFFTAQKMKFSTIDFFSKCDQIRNGKLRFLCSVWTLNYVDCIHLSCFDSFRMAHNQAK